MRIKATVTYNGAHYFGWQTQAHNPSIQEEIEKVLSTIHKEAVNITASGRTDRNVHALNQVFHFDTNLNLDESSWIKALNAQLPHDIRITHIEKVHEEFHARYDALSKTYHYKLNMGEYDVFSLDTITQFNKTISLDKLKEAASQFIGTHDFTSFNKTPSSVIEDQTRTITHFEIEEENNILIFKIKGDGFLRHMIRMLVATSIAYAEDRITLEKIQDALTHPSKEKIKHNIEGNGLYLIDVEY